VLKLLGDKRVKINKKDIFNSIDRLMGQLNIM